MPNILKYTLWVLGFLVIFIGLFAVIYIQTPWVKATLIRYAFEKQATIVSDKLEAHLPSQVKEYKNIIYGKQENDETLDIFQPTSTQENVKRPVIVWIHGGGWISGSKDEIANYIKILTSYSYITVGVNYTIAPYAKYPTQLSQVNQALKYLVQHADQYGIDSNKIVLAGDSAGAQIAAQVAAITTNPHYAQQLKIHPALQTEQLKAIILHCGVYNPNNLNYDGGFAGFLKTAMWAYLGEKDFLHSPLMQTLVIENYITPQFPKAFISVGNFDPLKPQSVELVDKLRQKNVFVDTLIFEKEYPVRLEHEYQFNLDSKEGQLALNRQIDFLKTHLNAEE